MKVAKKWHTACCGQKIGTTKDGYPIHECAYCHREYVESKIAPPPQLTVDEEIAYKLQERGKIIFAQGEPVGRGRLATYTEATL